jgi:GT2 family glycosyltransferase
MSTIDMTLKTLYEYTKDIDFKLYVVDNCSTDGTPEFIKNNYPQVEVIDHGKNVGFGAGHNVAINLIDSEYHVIINPDIVFIENAVKKMVEYLESNKDIGLLSPKICFPNGKEQILGKKVPHLKYIFASRLRGEEPGKLLKEYAMLDCDLTKPTEIENATGCFMMFRTSVLKKIGGFDERYFMYFEDADITREAKKLSRVVYYPDAVVSHVWNRDSKHNYKLLAIHIHSMLKYYLKWKTI